MAKTLHLSSLQFTLYSTGHLADNGDRARIQRHQVVSKLKCCEGTVGRRLWQLNSGVYLLLSLMLTQIQNLIRKQLRQRLNIGLVVLNILYELSRPHRSLQVCKNRSKTSEEELHLQSFSNEKLKNFYFQLILRGPRMVLR